MPSKERLISIWLFAVTALVLAMVVVGGYTRLTRSGLSIVEWKPVTGALPPLDEAAWNQAFAAYQASPEGTLINREMNLEAFKSIFLVEWFHRLLGRFVGVFFFLPWCFFAARRWLPWRVAGRYLLWFALGGLQGALGWFMVKSGLSDAPHVSPYRLTAHLGMALFVCAALWLEVLERRTPWATRPRAQLPNGLRRATAVLIAVTIAWGGLMAGHKAGWLSDTFPLMLGQLVPFDASALSPGALVSDALVVHFFHRVLGLITLALTAFVFFRTRGASPFERRAGTATFALAVLQVVLGIGTVMMHVPIWLAVVHQLNGALLLLAAISLNATPSAQRAERERRDAASAVGSRTDQNAPSTSR